MENIKRYVFVYLCAVITMNTVVPMNSSVPMNTSYVHIQNRAGVNTQADIFSPTAAQLLAIVRTELKKPEYARDILPHDFTYFNQLLLHGREMQSRHEYARSVCSIFSKVLGGSQYVNAYAFAQLLEVLPQTLKPYFISCKAYDELSSTSGLTGDMFDRFKESVSHTLYIQFSSQYDVFKASPLQFFDELSLYIADIAQQEMEIYYLRTAVKRFL